MKKEKITDEVHGVTEFTTDDLLEALELPKDSIATQVSTTTELPVVETQVSTTSERPDDSVAAPSSAELSKADRKLMQDKLRHRLQKAPSVVKEKYNRLKREGSEEAIMAFMEKVNKYAAGQLPGDFVEECSTITETKANGEDGGWESWALASTREGGDDILMEMANHGTITMRRNPRLPATANVPWPRCQQVQYVEEKFSKWQKVDNTKKTAKPSEMTPATFNANFQAATSAAFPPTPSATVAQAPQQGKCQQQENSQQPQQSDEVKKQQKQQIEDSKKVVATLRKAHNAWDRAKRDYNNLLQRSQENVNTAGCRFEKDVASATVAGEKLDGTIISLEAAFFNNKVLDEAQIKEACDTTNELFDLMKSSADKCSAIRSWFKVK